MASFFRLVLDTLPPQGLSLLLNGGATITTSKLITLNISTTDPLTEGYQMKIWGDIEEVFAEDSASWKPYVTSSQLTLSDGIGSKTIFVKMRDDVLNESAVVSAVIELNTSVPVVSIIAGPDLTKLSCQPTKDHVNFSWKCDTTITEWKVCITENENSPHSAGEVIAVVNGSVNVTGNELNSNEIIASKITAQDIILVSSDEGEKTIKVFVKTATDIWSL